MSKPIFSLVGLFLFAMAYPAGRAIAGSTVDSDRQFLANLENGTTTQAAPAPAPTPAVAPAMRATRPEVSEEPAPKAIAVVRKAPEKVSKRVVATEHVQPLPEVADGDSPTAAAPTATTATKVTVVKTTDADHDHDRDHDRDHHFFHRLFAHMLNNHPEDW